MEVSSDDDAGLSSAPALGKERAKSAGKRITFKDFKFGRTKSTPPNSIYSPPASASSSPRPNSHLHPAFEENREYDVTQRALTRTRSDEVGIRCKDEWAAGILAQEGLQESVVALRASVADYEKEASTQQWKDLLKIQADIRELGALADSSKAKSHSSSKDMDESADGLGKFTAVAFEYSKLLDVVMNSAPEYAALAWGVRLRST